MRAFHDSREGGSFAHEAISALSKWLEPSAAIDHAILRWMRWLTDHRMEDEFGISAGLPCLLGYAQRQQALIELAHRPVFGMETRPFGT